MLFKKKAVKKAYNPIKIAHRGDTYGAPENTIYAIEEAIAKQAHAVEIDVRTCKSGEVVLMHDKSVNRTTNGQGDVSQFMLGEIKKLVVGDQERIPTLIEVLQAVNARCKVFIELKHVSTAKPVADIVRHFVRKKDWMYAQLPVISFYHQSLLVTHEECPEVHLGASVKTMPESLAAVGEYTQSKYLLPDIDELTLGFVEDAHKRGLKVIPYTCNTDQQIAKAKKLKVDGIISDRYDTI